MCLTAAYRVAVNIGSGSSSSSTQISFSFLLYIDTGPEQSGVEGPHLTVHGSFSLTLDLSGEAFQWTMLVVGSLTSEVILGLDFLEANSCTINTATSCLHSGQRNVPLPLYCSEELLHLLYMEAASAYLLANGGMVFGIRDER